MVCKTPGGNSKTWEQFTKWQQRSTSIQTILYHTQKKAALLLPTCLGWVSNHSVLMVHFLCTCKVNLVLESLVKHGITVVHDCWHVRLLVGAMYNVHTVPVMVAVRQVDLSFPPHPPLPPRTTIRRHSHHRLRRVIAAVPAEIRDVSLRTRGGAQRASRIAAR